MTARREARDAMTTGEAEAYARGRRQGYQEAIADYGAKWQHGPTGLPHAPRLCERAGWPMATPDDGPDGLMGRGA